MTYDILTLTAIPLIRSVAGWLEAALEDNKITYPEWRKLIKTVLRLGVPGIALYYGLNLSPEIAASIPLIADYLLNNIKKVYLAKKE